MANRTTAADVKAIIDTQLDTTGVEVFIGSANLIVDTALGSTDLSADLLTEVEKWLSAHLIAITKTRQAESKKVGEATDKYGRLGMNLNSTTYGQTAQVLDISGSLAKMGLKATSIEAIPSFDDSPLYD